MNLFQLFLGSFYSSAAYRQMRASANFGMGYALFVVCVTTLFVMLYYGVTVYIVAFTPHQDKPALFDQIVQQVVDQAPVMTLKSGTLATKNPEPTIINLSFDAGQHHIEDPFITIDTTGAHTTANTTTRVLVTDKELYIKSGDKWNEPKPLSEYTKNGETIIINHAVAEEMGTHIVSYIHSNLFEYALFIWFFFVICLFVVSFFLLLFLGLIGLVIGAAVRSPLSFGAAVGLASLSFTPVAVLDALLLTFSDYAAHSLTLILAGTVTLYVGIKCSDPATHPAVA